MVDTGPTDTPATGSAFAPCLTCANAHERQGAHLFPHTMHKIRHRLWKTARQVSCAVLSSVMPTTAARITAQVPYCTRARRLRGAWTIA